MKRYIVGLFACVLLAGSPGYAQQPTLVVENGRVITGEGTVLEEASVVVAGDSILSVTQDPIDASEAHRIDASGKTVLPGLIDAHVHLTIPPDDQDSTALVEHLEERVPEILDGFLKHGVTTIRSTGDYWPWIGELRDRVTTGNLSGPGIVTAGPILTAKGGHPAVTVCDTPFCRSHLAQEVAGPKEARRAVRTLANEGVDFIKLVYHPLGPMPRIKDDVVAAIVEQAHREGLRAVGHVTETEVMQKYAELGLDGYVHPPILGHVESRTDAQVRQTARVLAEHGTPVTTTISVEPFYIIEGLEMEALLDGTSPFLKRLKSQARDIALLAEGGVSLALGTDWCDCAAGEHPKIQPGAVTITEMQMLRWGGMSRQAIIQAATANAARALEMEEKVGTLEAGKIADLIVADGNPLEDLSALEEVEVVVKGGDVLSAATGR